MVRYRLSSSMFTPREEEIENPGTVIYISAEGEATEKDYFEHMQTCFRKTGKRISVHIEVLGHRKGDGLSAPSHVVDLMDECIHLRSEDIIPGEISEKLSSAGISTEECNNYLAESELSDEKCAAISSFLLKSGIDINYRKFLKEFKIYETDRFVVVMDRDCKNHHEEELQECIKTCKEKGYELYLTNPCFEFWLLLHLCDVKNEYSTQMNELLTNRHVSHQHTFVSKEVSNRVGHGKHIPFDCFYKNYWGHIIQAKNRADQFATSLENILDNLGTNLGQLFTDDLLDALRSDSSNG